MTSEPLTLNFSFEIRNNNILNFDKYVLGIIQSVSDDFVIQLAVYLKKELQNDINEN